MADIDAMQMSVLVLHSPDNRTEFHRYNFTLSESGVIRAIECLITPLGIHQYKTFDWPSLDACASRFGNTLKQVTIVKTTLDEDVQTPQLGFFVADRMPILESSGKLAFYSPLHPSAPEPTSDVPVPKLVLPQLSTASPSEAKSILAEVLSTLSLSAKGLYESAQKARESQEECSAIYGTVTSLTKTLQTSLNSDGYVPKALETRLADLTKWAVKRESLLLSVLTVHYAEFFKMSKNLWML